MSSLKTIKVSIQDLSPNMVLAEDVKTKLGDIIVFKDTELNEMIYKKLKKNGINYVVVFEQTIKDEETFSVKYKKQLKKNEEYVLFTKNYKQSIETIKTQFFNISEYQNIDIDLLYNTVTNIIDNVGYKNDIFSYMCHLEENPLHIYTHSLNVGIIAYMFGIWLDFEQEELKTITLTGLLHDIGKTKLDENIINKEEALTKEEFEYIKTHSHLGYELLQDLDISDDIKYGVLMHHEKIDGSGYPIGLTGDRICKTAKVISTCDIYEAMTSYRVYRNKICPLKVILNFQQKIYELLDADLLLAFLRNIAYTYIGSYVILSDDRIAEIVFINSENITKPIVKVDNHLIDLSTEKNLDIDYIL